jgi:hypothetical protein
VGDIIEYQPGYHRQSYDINDARLAHKTLLRLCIVPFDVARRLTTELRGEPADFAVDNLLNAVRAFIGWMGAPRMQ